MSKQKMVSVVYFGSNKISILIGMRGSNNSLVVKGRGEAEYAGYMDGQFLEPENLKFVLGEALDKAETNSGLKVEHAFVGVPSEFSVVKLAEAEQNFVREAKIKNSHIENLLSQINIKNFEGTHTLINRAPIYFKINDGRKLINPIGLISTGFSCQCSFVFAENYFVNTVKQAFFDLGIRSLQFTSSILSQGLFLLPEEIRDSGAVLIHSKLLSTSIVAMQGDGILSLRSVGLGRGFIISDLMEILKVGYSTASALIKESYLSIETNPSDNYVIFEGNKPIKFEAGYINDIVKARLDMIADCILSAIKAMNENFLNLPFFITGGEIDAINGGRDYLAKCLGINITLAKNIFCKTKDSAVSALLDIALRQSE